MEDTGWLLILEVRVMCRQKLQQLVRVFGVQLWRDMDVDPLSYLFSSGQGAGSVKSSKGLFLTLLRQGLVGLFSTSTVENKIQEQRYTQRQRERYKKKTNEGEIQEICH
jgi:hypothetical protein